MSFSNALASLYDHPQTMIDKMINQVEKVIVGKRAAVEKAVIALLCRGHLLLEDVPGVGKTMLVKAMAKALDAGFRRIQFTPDLVPADVTGVSVYNPRTGGFEFREGPLFAGLVLADELNRTSPKTQAALLEAMEERQVTVDGETRRLPEPFMVLATQNPYDYEGTYPLPEAQLDRFLMRIRLGYPAPQDEVAMLDRMAGEQPLERLRPVLMREELCELQRLVRLVHADDSVKQYIVELVGATRRHPGLALGASPRASLALLQAAQAKAMTSGRGFVIPDDVKEMAPAVIGHRLRLAGEMAVVGKTDEDILQDILAKTAVPVFRSATGS